MLKGCYCVIQPYVSSVTCPCTDGAEVKFLSLDTLLD
jgi:hypothetical protein